MDGFQLMGLALILASITTWFALWTARNENFGAVKFELVCVAISWIAALLVTVYLAV